jgi:UDP-N-acetylglucosamine acyltransferase
MNSGDGTGERRMTRHRLAVVADSVVLAENVTVGPYTVIEGDVVIGPDTVIDERVSIKGNVTIGGGNRIFPGVTIGLPPQDVSYSRGPLATIIGDGNVIREYATIHSGVTDDTGGTVIGDDNMLMTYTHVAHNCRIGSRVIMANNAQIAGHVSIADRAVLGGFVGVHQFVRIGELSMTGGYSYCMQDVPPFMMVTANPARVVGPNVVGLKRAGMSSAERADLKKAHRLLFRERCLLTASLEGIEESYPDGSPVRRLAAFMRTSRRGICRGRTER